MEKIARWKRIRGTIRTAVTKLTIKINEELRKDEPNVTSLEEWNEQLNNRETSLTELDREIESITPVDDLDEEVNGAIHYMDEIKAAYVRTRRYREKLKEDASFESQSSIQGNRIPVMKLPKLTIENFSGDISKWQNFWSQFSETIHKNQYLSKSDKFNYLKSFLSGNAAKVVAGLSLTEDNYDHAVQMLTSRFGRKDLIINAHMNKLLSLSPVKRVTDIVALRNLYDECEVQVRSLDTMGVVSNAYGSLLCPILMKMIPEEITLEFTRQLKEDEVLSVRELMCFLQREVESRERTASLSQRQSSYASEKDSIRGREKPTSERRKSFFYFSCWCARRSPLLVLQRNHAQVSRMQLSECRSQERQIEKTRPVLCVLRR